MSNLDGLIRTRYEIFSDKKYFDQKKQMRNISVLQKLHLKIVSETTKETFVTKSMLTALKFRNTCGS